MSDQPAIPIGARLERGKLAVLWADIAPGVIC